MGGEPVNQVRAELGVGGRVRAGKGFAAERRKATRMASPASATTAPSCTATASTSCRDSTTPPRRTTTLMASTRGGYADAGAA